MFFIAVWVKAGLPDPRGDALQKDIQDLGIITVTQARVRDIYLLEGRLSEAEVDRICQELLADPVVQEYGYGEAPTSPGQQAHVIEVAYNPGVMDPVEESINKGIRDLGISTVDRVKTAKRYFLWGELSKQELETICDKLLVNPVIQHVVTRREALSLPPATYDFSLESIELLGLDDAALTELSKNRLWLNLSEMKRIQGYFSGLGRNPTDIELETLAQTWSEHCVHKTFKGKIKLGQLVIDNLLKSTIMRVTDELDKPWCLSVFEDNAGVIDFDGRYAICFKVETHNHPSAVEPYGGASTGIGGVIRDPLGTGLGSKPILNTDVFCFAPPDLPYQSLPPGVLHPRRIFKGVRAGVADYANRLGIPTLNGAILFDERYIGNPLVFCGTIGLLPKGMSQRGQQQPGDLVVLVGGNTGRDGIHGVTFASGELTADSEAVSSSSVQIGNPMVEKKLIDVLLKARDQRLYRRITDCGGGGLSSAVGEMARETGVRVYLERVPLKYTGLSYTEIWLSESQERMVLAAPPSAADQLIHLFASEDVAATVIGEFTDNHRLQLFYNGDLVGDLDMEFLHNGLPQLYREAVWETPHHAEPDFPEPPDLGKELLSILRSWNVCSKEWVIRQYDHEVQGGSVLKPLVGVNSDGPGDAAIIRPLLDSDMGIIVSNGINPKYGDIDPYWMAASAIDEALRQIVAVGGSLRRVALLDNFCWGNPEKPDRLGSLVRAAQACYDMAIAYETPFISGKDSLYNEYETKKGSICIPPTLLISAVAVMEQVERAISMDCKKEGNLIYIVGTTYDELGGSHYYGIHGFVGNNVPRVNPRRGKRLMDALSASIDKGLVRACHDLSEGGLGVAAAEMAFAGELGMGIHLAKVPLGSLMNRDDLILFSESNTRFLLEVTPKDRHQFEKMMARFDCAAIGKVTSDRILKIYGLSGEQVLSTPLAELKEAWQNPLRW
ncbi:MAG TPA: phosphoribosylformylglycinamidine synthase subunit PurL [Dehalococcoidia bacterium]|nr:phosphoribosylformylglycinamidine synthase subunit PurL [Dehalococcoidia bacterium]